MTDKKYKCEKCDISFGYISQLKNHNISKKHLGLPGKIHYCREENCDYQTNNKTNFKLHILNHHCTEEEKKQYFPYYCKTCKTGKMSYPEYIKHLNTKKHKIYNYSD